MIAARIEAETARLMNTLSAEELAQARDYTTGNHWLILWGLVVSGLVTWIIVRSGVLDKVAARLDNRFARNALTAAVFVLLSTVLTLPWSLYTDWWREVQYDQSSQPLGDFLAQGAIGLVVSAILTALLIAALYSLIRRAPRWWWAIAGAGVSVVAAGMLLLSPIVIEPLFNDYQPIPEGEVRDAVLALAADAGVPEDRVFMFDGSRQSNNFTANVSGIGASARIAISDTAMTSASLAEVRAVTGHEIGHFVSGHLWRMIAVISVLAMAVFFAVSRLYAAAARLFGCDAPIGDVRGLPVFLFLFGLCFTLTLPVTNTMTRIGEREADRYSLRTANEPDALASALIKTAEYRYPLAGPVEEAIFYTHPTVENRVRAAMAWKLANSSPTE